MFNTDPQKEIERCKDDITSNEEGISILENEIEQYQTNIDVIKYFIENEKPIGELVSEITLKLTKTSGKLTIKSGKTSHTFEINSSAALMTKMSKKNFMRVAKILESEVDLREDSIDDKRSTIRSLHDSIFRYQKMQKNQLFDVDGKVEENTENQTKQSDNYTEI